MKTIERLPLQFIGTGEVKGFKFEQVSELPTHYIYSVNSGEETHYEVFEVRETPLCIDFENRIYSDVQFKHVYPKSNDFGVWAWTTKKLEQAQSKTK